MHKRRIKCPQCHFALQSLTLAGTELDHCSSCNGCWLDAKEIDQLTRSRGRGHLSIELRQQQPSALDCPCCSHPTKLEVGEHSQIQGLFLDRCPQCQGSWLDRGELTTLLSWKSDSDQ